MCATVAFFCSAAPAKAQQKMNAAAAQKAGVKRVDEGLMIWRC